MGAKVARSRVGTVTGERGAGGEPEGVGEGASNAVAGGVGRGTDVPGISQVGPLGGSVTVDCHVGLEPLGADVREDGQFVGGTIGGGAGVGVRRGGCCGN
jgi:hypothetical protein